MPEYKNTNPHLTICSANYLRIKKIMFNFEKKSQRLRKNDANKNFIAEIKYSSISKHTAELYLEFSNLSSLLYAASYWAYCCQQAKEILANSI